MAKVEIKGLRTMDATMLQVSTSEVLRLPLIRTSTGTLCDMLAISEVDDLPKALVRDFAAYQKQLHREIRDLPKGRVLGDFLYELCELEPERIPQNLREVIAERVEFAATHPDSNRPMEILLDHLEGTDPQDVMLGNRTVRVQRHDVPDSHKAPDERTRTRKRRETTTVGEDGERRRTPSAPRALTPTSSKDPARAEWLREDVLERLSNYGSSGLKEAILVAGAKHRAPWKDIANDEVMAVLRALGRENKVRHSAGRWSRVGRW